MSLEGEFAESLTRMDINGVRRIISSHLAIIGWNEIFNALSVAIDDVLGAKWFAINQIILEIFEAEELIGIDADVLEVLKMVPTLSTFEMIQAEFQKQLHTIVREQIRNGGCTFFFDTQKMSNRSSCILLTEIENARRKEFAAAFQVFHDSDERLSHSRKAFNPIWNTEYGFRILRTLRLDFPSFTDAWDNIVSAVEKTADVLDIDLLEYPKDLPNKNWPLDRHISNHMRDLVNHLIIIFAEPDTVDRAIHNHLFETGYLNPSEIVRAILSGLIKDSQVKNMYLLDNAEINELGVVRDLRIQEDLYFPAAHLLVESRYPDALDLLLRVLNTQFEVFDYSRFNPLQEAVLSRLAKEEDERIGKAAMEFIVSNTELEFISGEGFVIQNITNEAFWTATDLIIRYNQKEALPFYWKLAKEEIGYAIEALSALADENDIEHFLEFVYTTVPFHPSSSNLRVNEEIVEIVLKFGLVGVESIKKFIEEDRRPSLARDLIETIWKKGGKELLPEDDEIVKEIMDTTS